MVDSKPEDVCTEKRRESSQLDDATADVVRTLLSELSVLMSKMDKKQAVSQKF